MSRIVHAVHGFPPDYRGGTEHYVDTVARCQQRAGHDVRVLTGFHQTAAHATIRDEVRDGLPVSVLARYGLCGDRWDQIDAPHSEARVRAWLGRARPDVVFVHHFVRLTRTIARTAASLGIPVVWTFHDLSATCPCFNRVDEDGRFRAEPLDADACIDLVDRDRWQHREELVEAIEAYLADARAEVAAAALRLAPSAAQRDLVAALLGLDDGSVRAMPFGLPRATPRFTPAPAPFGRPLRVVHWGSLYRDKGTHILVEAVRRVHERHPGAIRLDVFGDAVFADYGERLRALAADGPIVFHGAFTDLAVDPTAFDVAVLPTLAHESYGFVLDEAHARGLPAIVSRLGALPERVGAAGQTVEPNDPVALASALEALVATPETGRVWRAALPSSFRTLDEHAADLESVVEEAIALGPPSSAPAPPRRSAARLRRERALVNRQLACYRPTNSTVDRSSNVPL